MNSSTAILLFSRTAAAEAQSKGFGAGVRGNERLADRLITRAEATLGNTGLPVFRSDEAAQRGATFGERLANAMADVYEQGYERLLVVGNDCPSVRSSHLRAAAQLLAQGKNVLGPDHRGGIWLLGLQRQDFHAETVASLHWQSASVYRQLTELLPALEELSRLSDLNTLSELRQLWRYVRTQLSGVADLVFTPIPVVGRLVFCLDRAAVMQPEGRGPPVGVVD